VAFERAKAVTNAPSVDRTIELAGCSIQGGYFQAHCIHHHLRVRSQEGESKRQIQIREIKTLKVNPRSRLERRTPVPKYFVLSAS
jgi:hypothetical protein